MQLNTLYYLMRLYNLYSDCEETIPCDFEKTYCEITSHTSKDILSEVPAKISHTAQSLLKTPDMALFSEFCAELKPYAQQCHSLLPSLCDENVIFTNILSDEFLNNGYFLKNNTYRKVRKDKLFLIEAELAADFVADDLGNVTAIRIFPLVRVAEAKLKTAKDKKMYTDSGILDDDATVSDIKLFSPDAFFKTLRHLKTLEFSPEQQIKLGGREISEIAESAKVASAVCENRAIPRYYKKLCRKDFSLKKALTLAAFSALLSFAAVTLITGLSSGILVYIFFGFTKIFGLFARPELYLFSLAISLVYSITVFNNARNVRF